MPQSNEPRRASLSSILLQNATAMLWDLCRRQHSHGHTATLGYARLASRRLRRPPMRKGIEIVSTRLGRPHFPIYTEVPGAGSCPISPGIKQGCLPPQMGDSEMVAALALRG